MLNFLRYRWYGLLLLVLLGCSPSESMTPPSASTQSEALDLEQFTPGDNRTEDFRDAVELFDKGQLAEAEANFQQLVLKNPEDFEAVFYLANIKKDQGDIGVALELLASIPAQHPQLGVPALGVSADWCLADQLYEKAESRYQKILEVDPSVNPARRQLAFLYNRMGRRHEATKLIRQLMQRGDVMQDELHSLIVESDAMIDSPGSVGQDQQRLYLPIGAGAEARSLFTQRKYREAVELVRDEVASEKASASLIAFFGIAAAESQNLEQFQWWLGQVTPTVKEFPEYWAAMGTYLMMEADYPSAIRALGESIRRDPTDLRSIRRMIQGFRSLGDSEQEAIWTKRFESLHRSVDASNRIAELTQPQEQQIEMIAIASEMESMGRRLEAIMWQSAAAMRQVNPESEISILNQRRLDLVDKQSAFPTAKESLCNIVLDKYPLPQEYLALPSANAKDNENRPQFPASSQPALFQDISKQIGLNHAFKIARKPQSRGFAIYQSYGGGTAVIDFDLDGWPDLYFSQGAADPPEFVADQFDQLFRNLSTNKLLNASDVTKSAELIESDYSVGVTAGDWNQDGLSDLAVANLGIDRLMLNQGDGTFRSIALDDEPELSRADTSLAMGDVTGDHLPDLFVLSYLDDERIAKRPAVDDSGNVSEAIPPLSVTPSRDRVYINDGKTKWYLRQVGQSPEDAATGLGVVITDLNGRVGNEVFVGNDERKNQLWFLGSEMSDEIAALVDRGPAMGVAYGAHGAATGSMGIATADFDRNGQVDLHVANYLNEPVSLYMQDEGLFRDLNVRYQLSEPSFPMVGFGCQAIDYNSDGWLDLAVANGHVEYLEHNGEPFKQPMQLFANRGDRFELAKVSGSEFWEKPHLGRAMAVLDFNRDGKQDIVVTDMLESSELLLNQTVTPNHWIEFQLVGTACERDAIGATAEVQVGPVRLKGWVTAGDGYLCKNEPVLHFGLARSEKIDNVVIIWPNGSVQTVSGLEVDQRHLIVQETYAP
jgi:tetratricopeptide (TPR) repeat protein